MEQTTMAAVTWHTGPLDHVFKALQSNEQGLSSQQARQRLAQHGPNQLPRQPPPTWWQILLRQFQSPLIYVLVAAAIVSFSTGDFKDSGFIAAVLAVNAVIGGYQEWRAEQSSRALQQLLRIRASVVRDGEVHEIDAEELVPGDVVWLESGNRIPADVRFISAHGLEVDESLLTGESVAVTKVFDWKGDESVPIADRLNMGYAASIVIRGRAKGVIVSTGTNTMVGQLAVDVLSASGGKPPLLQRMERFAHTIAYAVLVAVAIVSVMGIFIHGHTIKDMFLFGVALAVSAIPEGLPAALTVALAIATSRMARRRVIVRRLAAVEGLGSCTMIASDKTGTLTCNELTVRDVRLADGTNLIVRGQGFAPEGDIFDGDEHVNAADREGLFELVRVAVLCNEADLHRRDGNWVWHGDPTDIALLSFGHKAGVQREDCLSALPQINEIPFEPEHQFAATYHCVDGSVWAYIKGAPERVLNMCDWTGNETKLAEFQSMAESMASEGYRVLALADAKVVDELSPTTTPPQPSGLELRGFVGMIDPLRPGVRDAVETCHAAGITVCMVTGDHPVTALAIARDLGLASEPHQVVSGTELSGQSLEELRAAIRRGRVFARVAPRQKLELVQAARAEGHFVAVTGDGVNDAPALRAANIGVAMGKSGTDVAREAAELVISDDNFATIVSGVEEGRVAYDNVRKVIYLLVSSGAAEVLLIGLAFAVGSVLPLPLWPVQLLWLNLVTNGIQGIALAFEPREAGILRRKPRRPSEPIFDRLMAERTMVAAGVMAVVGVIAFSWMIHAGWSHDSARNALLLLLVLFENVHIGNCRSETHSAFRLSPFRSPFLLAGAIGAFLLHVIAMHLPLLQSVLRTEPVSLSTWMVMILLASTILIAIELHKWIWRVRNTKNGS
ncbi:MAG: HAD-IC family P-type ATPase [Pirellulales bacterium]|nr:HAD-IC family P-type ATPase [Pirellulales bacterium]